MTPASDPVHEPGGPGTAWSTTNAGENFPGVATPLGWTFWREGIERGMRGAFADLGVLRADEVVFPSTPDEQFTSVFFGHYTGNVDRMRAMSDLMPGTSGSETELQIFGSVRPEAENRPSRRRYPALALKFPAAVWRSPRILAGEHRAVESWWRAETTRTRPRTDDELAALLLTARDRFERIMRPHILASMVASAVYSRLEALATAAGHPGLETALVSGYGGLKEAATVADLWEVSRERMTVAEFLLRHGYHADVEAELRSVAWREDPAPVRARAASFARREEAGSPAALFARQAGVRRTAERTLLGAIPAARRPLARAVLHMTARSVPLREVGKAGFLQAIDVGRLAARELGVRLAERGAIETPDDVFFLTLDEVTRTPPRDPRATVTHRRTVHLEYERLHLPRFWTGVPEPERERAQDDGEVKGIAVSPGVVEGTVRVMSGADDGDLEDGEILVCATTDPSWASLFFVASAVVIDLGGPMSHGAIVAREMGIPCVINTRNGTSALRSGDRIRVDGSTGDVTVIDRTAV